MAKVPIPIEVQKRIFGDPNDVLVMVCYKCKRKQRVKVKHLLEGKAKCRYCGSKELRPKARVPRGKKV